MRRIATFIFGALFTMAASNANAQYCTPTNLSSTWDGISNVTVTNAASNFSNPTSIGAQYTDYTASHTAFIVKNQAFNISITNNWYGDAWIDWNGDGDFTDAGEDLYSGTWNHGSGSNTRTLTVTPPASATAGQKRLRVGNGYSTAFNSCGPTTSNWAGEYEDYGLFVMDYQNSAGLETIDSPKQIVCSTVQDVDVSFKNIGKANLTSLKFGGEIITYTTGSRTVLNFSNVQWTGSLAPFTSVSSPFNVYTMGFTSGFAIGDTVTVWCYEPNGVTDTLSGDDTMRVIIGTGMSGTYTIGDTVGGANDFPDFTSAVNFMDSIGAVCDTTYFLVDDTITYTEQIGLSPLINMDWDAPVIFKTKDGAAGQAEINFGPTSTGNNYVVRMNTGASYYIFEDIHIHNTNVGSSYGACVFLQTNANYNRFKDCWIQGQDLSTVSFSTYNAVVTDYAPPNYGETFTGNEFIGNVIEGGYYNLQFRGQGSTDNLIEGNEFKDAYYYGIYMNYPNSPKINGNSFMSASPNTFSYGVYLSYSQDGFEFNNNTINPGIFQWPRYGLYANRCDGKANKHNEIKNNCISVGQSWSSNTQIFYGIYGYYTSFTDIVNNAIVARGNSFDTYPLYMRLGGANVVQNNIIANYGSGAAVNYDGTSTVIKSDNNNFYANGFIKSYYNGFGFLSLNDWQTRAGYDANSVGGNPGLYDVGNSTTGMVDCHACNTQLDGAGDASVAPMYDIDDEMRDSQNPDIGPDEFVGLGNISLGSDVVFCPGDTVGLETPQGIVGTPIWSTGDTALSIETTMPGDYSFVLRNTCGLVVDTVNLSNPMVSDIDNGDTLICNGDAISVEVNLSGATYDWNNGMTSKSITITDAGTYAVVVTDMYGCVTGDSLTVTKSEDAKLNVASSDTTLCPGQFLSLEAGVTPRTGVAYQWNGLRDGTNPTTNNLLVGWDAADSLEVMVDDNGCITYDVLYIDNPPAPEAGFTDSLFGWTVFLDADTVHPRFTYNWDLGDGNTSGMPNLTHVYRNKGTYIIVLEVSTECGTETSQVEVETVQISVDENDLSNNVSVYPNPSSGNLKVSLGELSGDFDIEVQDANGKIIHRTNVEGSNEADINLTDVATGVYFVRVLHEDKVNVQKINIR